MALPDLPIYDHENRKVVFPEWTTKCPKCSNSITFSIENERAYCSKCNETYDREDIEIRLKEDN